MGRRAPDPSREDAQTGRARGRGRRAGRPPGRARAARPGLPNSARLPGLGPPRTGRMEACRDSPFVQRRLSRAGGRGLCHSLGWERDGGFPARAPPPPARPPPPPPPPPLPPLPRARRRRRLLGLRLRPRGLPFLLRPGCGVDGGSPSPGAG